MFRQPPRSTLFPTRRSSDLIALNIDGRVFGLFRLCIRSNYLGCAMLDGDVWGNELRSEEHTSELQSQSNLVCRLLLEKKKPSIAHAWRPPARAARSGRAVRPR